MMEKLKSDFSWVARHFLSWKKHPDRLWAPTSLLTKTYRVGFLRAKQSGRKADHFNPPSADVKNMWSYTSTLPRGLTVWCLANHRDIFNIPFFTVLHSDRPLTFLCKLYVLQFTITFPLLSTLTASSFNKLNIKDYEYQTEPGVVMFGYEGQ
jgi:hypothetical protein